MPHLKRCSFKKQVSKYSFNLSIHGSHVKILRYAGKNKKVLDVGCGTGYLAERLKMNGCYVVGIEQNAKSAEIAKKYCDKVIITDIESARELPIERKTFDVILYGDVLEHLREPLDVLVKLTKYCKEGRYVVASIPNIANWSIRLKLLFGKFDYQDTGILDRTHLRFFTLRTINNLFAAANYKIKGIDYTGLASKLGPLNMLPALFAWQFIVIAEPLERVK